MPAHIVPEKASEQPICPGEGHTVPVITEASLLEEWVCLSIMSQLWRDSLRENRHMDVTSFGTSTLGQFLSPLSYLKCFSHQPMAYNCHAHPIPLKPIRSSEIVATVSIRNCDNSQGAYVHFKGEVKITVRDHHTPTTMAKTKNTDNTKCWQGAKQQELSYTDDRNTKWDDCFGKLFGNVY